MDERTMFDLLEIREAVDRLYEVEKLLIGNCVGVGPGEGIIGDLEYHTMEAIMRHSPLHNEGDDILDSYFGKVLYDKEMDNHQKARILLGL